MSKFTFVVTKLGVEGITVNARHGDSIYFVPDHADPPPANGSLGVTSLTAGVSSSELFNGAEVPLSGEDAVPRQVQASPGQGRVYEFEVGPNWSAGVSGEGGLILVPTKGKINVGSNG